MQDDIRSKVSFIFESLSTGQGLPADTVVFTETRELLSVLNPSAPRVWEAGPTHPTVADIAGWHAARAAATSAAPPPLVLTTLGPLETRSYGALAHAFFEAKETRAKAVGPPAHQQAAHIAQQLAQDELQREIDKVSADMLCTQACVHLKTCCSAACRRSQRAYARSHSTAVFTYLPALQCRSVAAGECGLCDGTGSSSFSWTV